ncbi:invasion associated locus B family protein [Szabonella alba]|uniref:Invasion associated locus B family protein n=1 Tax=Szabonella alba TaxID=2804194 RepID=A0A8K0V7H0_9RHOB|nr:invasion associated locus B family protein [Szabonella alba]MBL4917154.1 invasion associated locus B family protein [Szabonella alba]
MWHLSLLPAGVVAAFAFAAPLQAEVANGTVFGDWRVACTAATSTRTSCALTQTLANREGNTFLAEIGLNVARNEGDAAVVMVLRTPSSMALAMQPGVLIDGRDEQLAMTWRTCAGDFCTALVQLDEAAIADLRAAASMVVGYQGINAAEPTSFAVSLQGVTAGLTALSAE